MIIPFHDIATRTHPVVSPSPEPSEEHSNCDWPYWLPGLVDTPTAVSDTDTLQIHTHNRTGSES